MARKMRIAAITHRKRQISGCNRLIFPFLALASSAFFAKSSDERGI